MAIRHSVAETMYLAALRSIATLDSRAFPAAEWAHALREVAQELTLLAALTEARAPVDVDAAIRRTAAAAIAYCPSCEEPQAEDGSCGCAEDAALAAFWTEVECPF